MSKIFFCYATCGGGHIAPANALKTAIEDRYPGKHDLYMCDFLHDLGMNFKNWKMVDSWDVMLKYSDATRWGYDILNHHPWIPKVWIRMQNQRVFRRAKKFIDRERPDICVCTHFQSAYVLGKIRNETKHPFKLLTVSSDPHSSHVFWEILKDQDYFICDTEKIRSRIREVGNIPQEKVKVFPYPVNPRFFDVPLPDKQVFLPSLGLDPQKKTLLISFGGQGVGPIEKYIAKLHKTGIPLNVIVVCGKNGKVKKHLEKVYGGMELGELNLSVQGFVTNMNEFSNHCDFCFIKPGAATSYEFFLLNKPVIFYKGVLHIEDSQVDFAERHGLGLFAGTDENRFINCVKRMLSPEFEDFKENYRKLNLQNGAYGIASFIDSLE